MKSWQLQSAKAQLSQLIQNAIMNGPQQITKLKLSFVQFIQQSPLTKLRMKFKRDKSLTRDIDL